MATYAIGSKGPEVTKIQERLKALGLYLGPLDGDFGGGTESAVIRFQTAEGLDGNGQVGPDTWKALFPQDPDIPNPTVTQKPLLDRCLELTGGFETSLPPPACYAKVTGNFDGQGISFGALQFNLGQGSLQAVFSDLDRKYPGVLEEVFHVHAPTLREKLQLSKASAVAWAKSIQSPRFQLFEPWRGLFQALGQRKECQEVQCGRVKVVFEKALALCRTYGVRSERAAALMFDIITQNGSISTATRKLIESDLRSHPLTGDLTRDDPARLVVIANRRANAASARWREDVRRRKLTIANGTGVVHGSRYHLEAQYGIRLEVVAGL